MGRWACTIKCHFVSQSLSLLVHSSLQSLTLCPLLDYQFDDLFSNFDVLVGLHTHNKMSLCFSEFILACSFFFAVSYPAPLDCQFDDLFLSTKCMLVLLVLLVFFLGGGGGRGVCCCLVSPMRWMWRISDKRRNSLLCSYFWWKAKKKTKEKKSKKERLFNLK